MQEISIHALREEGDVRGHADYSPRADFYPRPPRGGRRSARIGQDQTWKISIHALREEGDNRRTTRFDHRSEFLSTPSARRATRQRRTWCWSSFYFYPRPPRGGRLRRCYIRRHSGQYFYPRPPRGGRPACYLLPLRQCPISIHALREEGDAEGSFCPPSAQEFLSTPSARRATFQDRQCYRDLPISIHALREEGD